MDHHFLSNFKLSIRSICTSGWLNLRFQQDTTA